MKLKKSDNNFQHFEINKNPWDAKVDIAGQTENIYREV